jgi:hypothetical protein
VLAAYGHGLLALQDGDLDEAERLLADAGDGFASLRTPVWEGWTLVTRARCLELRGDPPAARALYDAARALGVQAGEPGLTASALEGLARTTVDDAELAGQLGREAADVRERLGRPRPGYQAGWGADG